MTHDLHPNEKLVFGSDASRVHLPYIARTQGISVAEAMLVELDAAAKNRMPIELLAK